MQVTLLRLLQGTAAETAGSLGLPKAGRVVSSCLAVLEIQKSLAAMPAVTIAGALEYQACDDKLCYNPARVPFSFALTIKGLDRRPPG